MYLTIRQPSRHWTWPDPDEPLPADALSLSWALVLEDFGGGRIAAVSYDSREPISRRSARSYSV